MSPAFAAAPADCITKSETLEVRGTSLAPLINPGETIELARGYYDCHAVERDDVVAYRYAGNAAPIVKIVKAVPGDRWRLEKTKDAYLIVVNAKPVLNSQGKAYRIPASGARMLKLYADSYPVLPENTYLILGNNVTGSLDATRFGLVDKRDILGRVRSGRQPRERRTRFSPTRRVIRSRSKYSESGITNLRV